MSRSPSKRFILKRDTPDRQKSRRRSWTTLRPACETLDDRQLLATVAPVATKILIPPAAAIGKAAFASAGDSASNQAALSAFAQQVQQGLAPTLTVEFGTPAASGPAGTVVMPDVAYSSGLGYGWLSDPGRIHFHNGAVIGRSGDFEVDIPAGTYDVTVTPAASPDLSAGSQVAAYAAGNTLGGPGGSSRTPARYTRSPCARPCSRAAPATG